jgi:hypothetical protein
MHGSRLVRSSVVGFTLLLVGLTVAACGGSSNQVVTSVPAGATGAANSTAAVTGGGGTTPPSGTPVPGATGTVTGNSTVSPGSVTMGNVVLTLTLATAKPMLDPSSLPSTPSGDSSQQSESSTGYVILGGSGLKVTNNFDPSQTAPADQPNAYMRHVSVQIKDKGTAQLIPSLVITADLLREGRPVLQDQALVPMVPQGGGASQMAYGNNVVFPGPGQYEVFVRLAASPLLGSSATGTAQFNITLQ